MSTTSSSSFNFHVGNNPAFNQPSFQNMMDLFFNEHAPQDLINDHQEFEKVKKYLTLFHQWTIDPKIQKLMKSASESPNKDYMEKLTKNHAEILHHPYLQLWYQYILDNKQRYTQIIVHRKFTLKQLVTECHSDLFNRFMEIKKYEKSTFHQRYEKHMTSMNWQYDHSTQTKTPLYPCQMKNCSFCASEAMEKAEHIQKMKQTVYPQLEIIEKYLGVCFGIGHCVESKDDSCTHEITLNEIKSFF